MARFFTRRTAPVSEPDAYLEGTPSYMLKKLVVGDMSTNCYLVGNPETKELVIIDPGYDAPLLKRTIHDLEYTPVAILLTHGHYDHITAANELRRFYGVKLYAGRNEEELLASTDFNLSEMFGHPMELMADELLTGDQMIELGGMYITVLETPGHTSGSVSYFFPLWQLLFSGDTLFMESVGRTDFPTGNEGKMIDSIVNVIYELPITTMCFPGHGPATNLEYESRNNLYIHKPVNDKLKGRTPETEE